MRKPKIVDRIINTKEGYKVTLMEGYKFKSNSKHYMTFTDYTGLKRGIKVVNITVCGCRLCKGKLKHMGIIHRSESVTGLTQLRNKYLFEQIKSTHDKHPTLTLKRLVFDVVKTFNDLSATQIYSILGNYYYNEWLESGVLHDRAKPAKPEVEEKPVPSLSTRRW